MKFVERVYDAMFPGTRGESKVLFVRNLSYSTDESSLKAAFKGAVSARIPTFQDSGKPKG